MNENPNPIIHGSVVLNVSMGDKPDRVRKQVDALAAAGIQCVGPVAARNGVGRPKSANAKAEEPAGPFETAYLKLNPAVTRMRVIHGTREAHAKFMLKKAFGTADLDKLAALNA